MAPWRRLGRVTWVLAVLVQIAEAGMGQSPQLVLLEGPAQLGQEVLQGDALGKELWVSHRGRRAPRTSQEGFTAMATVRTPVGTSTFLAKWLGSVTHPAAGVGPVRLGDPVHSHSDVTRCSCGSGTEAPQRV